MARAFLRSWNFFMQIQYELLSIWKLYMKLEANKEFIENLSLHSTRVDPGGSISTNIDICINNIDFAMVILIRCIHLAVRCAYWDHEEKKQKVCFVTHFFLDKVWNYPKFQGFSTNDCED